jgi:hypothetical protein
LVVLPPEPALAAHGGVQAGEGHGQLAGVTARRLADGQRREDHGQGERPGDRLEGRLAALSVGVPVGLGIWLV